MPSPASERSRLQNARECCPSSGSWSQECLFQWSSRHLFCSSTAKKSTPHRNQSEVSSSSLQSSTTPTKSPSKSSQHPFSASWNDSEIRREQRLSTGRSSSECRASNFRRISSDQTSPDCFKTENQQARTFSFETANWRTRQSTE